VYVPGGFGDDAIEYLYIVELWFLYTCLFSAMDPRCNGLYIKKQKNSVKHVHVCIRMYIDFFFP